MEKPLTGEVRLHDGTIITDPVTAVQHNMAYISKDRDKESIILDASIQANVVLPSLPLLRHKIGDIPRRKEAKLTKEQIEAMHIKCRGGNQLIKELSGGNKQQVKR